MNKLLESDFLTVNLSSVVKPQKASQPPEEKASDDTAESNNKSAKVIKDWAEEFKQRVSENNKLSPEARKSSFEIEDQFWAEFFTANWNKPLTAPLKSIELLRDDIKKLGFTEQTNPVIAFLKLNYVKENLLITRLINSNTYKVIHNAIAKRLVADSEFFKDSDYNIIYCKDFYTKPLKDMIDYLNIQKVILPTSATTYNQALQEKNISLFLQPGQTSVKQQNAKLKGLKEIEETEEIKQNKEASENDTTSSETASRPELKSFISNLKSLAQVQATLQFVSMLLADEQAARALSSDIFKKVSVTDLLQATRALSNKLNKVQISKQNSEVFVQLLIKRAKELK